MLCVVFLMGLHDFEFDQDVKTRMFSFCLFAIFKSDVKVFLILTFGTCIGHFKFNLKLRILLLF